MWRTLTVLLLGLAVLQIRAQDPTQAAAATPTTTATTTTSSPTTTTTTAIETTTNLAAATTTTNLIATTVQGTGAASLSTAAASSTPAPLTPTTTAATTEPATTPLQLTTLDISNSITAIDGKLLLQNSVALSNQVQSLIDEINALEASVNATNSPYFDQMTQMQANATQMNATLTALIAELNVQNGRLENLNVTVANFTDIYSCFARSQCVTPVPSTTIAPTTTTPPPDPCPTIRAEKVTDVPKEYDVPASTNVQCSDLFTADDGFNVVFEGNVTIVNNTAALKIYNANTGTLISSIVASGNVTLDTKVQSAQIFYSANWLSSIEFHLSYYAVNQSDPCADPNLCNGGTCTVDPNTGGALCICEGCKTGDRCELETDPCATATAQRRCRVNVDPTDGRGTCSVDDTITDYCAYKCNCPYPVEGVSNLCAAPSQLQYATWWKPSQTMSLSPLYKIWKNLW